MRPNDDLSGAEWEVRHHALHNLWSAAVREVEVRHPDPRVYVSLILAPRESTTTFIKVRMEMREVRDTIDRDRKLSSLSSPWDTFSMELHTMMWPGQDMAEILVAGAWVMYMMHETTELVTRPGAYWNRIIEPHTSTGRFTGDGRNRHAGDMLGPAFREGLSSDEDMVRVAATIVGEVYAEGALMAARGRAEVELLEEEAWVRGEREAWQ